MPHHAVQISRGAASEPRAAAPAKAPEAALFDHLPGKSEYLPWHGHSVHYRAVGDGPPLVLVHSPDIGGSCLEWRRNMEYLAADFRVYAVDLPGFGLSDAKAETYTADTFIRFLSDFLQGVVGETACAIGAVQGASYLLHVAAHRPQSIGRMLLVCPAGLSSARAGSLSAMRYQLMGLPGVSQAVCGTATTRYTILEHLQRDVYVDDQAAGAQAVDARYWVCHKPNASCVDRSRLAGLMNVDIRAAVRQLATPVMLAWGRQAQRPPLTDAEIFTELKPHAPLAIFERSALAPHEEEPGKFNQAARGFLCSEVHVSA